MNKLGCLDETLNFQVETRQRQLDSLRRMEERYRNLTASTSGASAAASAGSSASKPSKPHGPPVDPAPLSEKSKQLPGVAALAEGGTSPSGLNPGRCSCNRLAMYVLDISRALSEEHEVEWLPFRSNASLAAPEETILYTLVAGRSGKDSVSFQSECMC